MQHKFLPGTNPQLRALRVGQPPSFTSFSRAMSHEVVLIRAGSFHTKVQLLTLMSFISVQATESHWEKMNELKQRYNLKSIQPDLWVSPPLQDDWYYYSIGSYNSEGGVNMVAAALTGPDIQRQVLGDFVFLKVRASRSPVQEQINPAHQQKFDPEINMSQLVDTIMYHKLMAEGDSTQHQAHDLGQLDSQTDFELQHFLTVRMLHTLAERRQFLIQEVNASISENRKFSWDRLVPSLSCTTENMVRGWENSDSSRGFGAGSKLVVQDDNHYERLLQTDTFFQRRRVLGARAQQIWTALSEAGDAITSDERALTHAPTGEEIFELWSLSGLGEDARKSRLMGAIAGFDHDVGKVLSEHRNMSIDPNAAVCVQTGGISA